MSNSLCIAHAVSCSEPACRRQAAKSACSWRLLFRIKILCHFPKERTRVSTMLHARRRYIIKSERTRIARNCSCIAAARCGMCMSPQTRTSSLADISDSCGLTASSHIFAFSLSLYLSKKQKKRYCLPSVYFGLFSLLASFLRACRRVWL